LRGETLDNEMHVLYRLPQDTIDIRRSYPKHRWKSFEKKREAIAAAKEEETRVMDRSLEAITSADTLTAIKENRIFPDVRTTTDLEKLHTFDPSNGPALTQGEQVELYLSERDTHEERSLRRITSTPSMRNEVLKEAQKQGITYTRPNEFHGTSSQGVRSIEELRKLPSQLQKNIFHL
jgi:precorrin-6x reductase